MNRRALFGIAVTLVVVAVAASLGWWAYTMGLAQGALQSAPIIVPEGGAVPYYHYGPGYGWRGFGLGPLGCLFPILGFVLLFLLLRGVFGGWGRRGFGLGWGGPGRHSGPPPMFEEWHRRAHGEEPPAPPPTGE